MVVVSGYRVSYLQRESSSFHTLDDHDAPMAEFFLMNGLCLYKRLLEEGIKFHGLVESDHAVH